jgi:hypothetical protein
MSEFKSLRPEDCIQWVAATARVKAIQEDARGRSVTVIDWLLDSDPSMRWQVMRDLTGAPAGEVAAERARVATEGLGSEHEPAAVRALALKLVPPPKPGHSFPRCAILFL